MGQEFRKVRAGTVCSIASGTSARTTRRLQWLHVGQEAFGGLFTHEFSRRAHTGWLPLARTSIRGPIHSHPGNLMLLAWRLVALKMSVPRTRQKLYSLLWPSLRSHSVTSIVPDSEAWITDLTSQWQEHQTQSVRAHGLGGNFWAHFWNSNIFPQHSMLFQSCLSPGGPRFCPFIKVVSPPSPTQCSGWVLGKPYTRAWVCEERKPTNTALTWINRVFWNSGCDLSLSSQGFKLKSSFLDSIFWLQWSTPCEKLRYWDWTSFPSLI